MDNLIITKNVACPKSELYAAWVEPEQLKTWWHPMGNMLESIRNDVKEGGTFRYTFKDNHITIEGTYQKAEEAKLLEYTWNWHFTNEPANDANYRLHVAFSESETGSSIKVTQEGLVNEEAASAHKKGWEDGLAALQNYLEGGKSDGSENKQHPEISGYMETPEQQKVGGG